MLNSSGRGFRRFAWAAAGVGILPLAGLAQGEPVPPGQHALLSISVQVEGSGERHSRANGIDVVWSTHRAFEGAVEMVAEKAQGMSFSGVDRKAAQPSADLQALQKEMEQCGDNQGCQMAVTAKLMQNPEMLAHMQQVAGPPRYQVWHVFAKSTRAQVKTASYVDDWDAVLLAGAREETRCKLSAGNASAGDRRALVEGAQGLMLETDLRGGSNRLLLAIASSAQGDLQCTKTYAGKTERKHETPAVRFVPYVEKAGGWLEGAGGGSGATLARGEQSFELKYEVPGGLLAQPVPLKVKVRWELTRL